MKNPPGNRSLCIYVFYEVEHEREFTGKYTKIPCTFLHYSFAVYKTENCSWNSFSSGNTRLTATLKTELRKHISTSSLRHRKEFESIF
jgi:hypothetical protein